MSVMIIGSGGFMGRHLVDRLAELNIQVACASSTDGSGIDPVSGLLPLGFSIPEGARSVVYLAQSPRYRDCDQASHVLSVNVVSAVRAATAAYRAGVERFIYVSTGTVYAPSFSPLAEDSPLKATNWYSLSKIHAEQAISMFQTRMNVHVVRPFGVYGRHQRDRLVPNLISAISKDKPIIIQKKRGVPDDESGLRISLCHVDDAINMIVNILLHGGPEIMNLAGAEVVSIRRLAVEIGKQMRKEPIFEISPNFRDFDLIADVSLMLKFNNPEFTPLSVGIKKIVCSD